VKVMIIVLVAIAVAAVLVLFYGAVRPDGDPDASEDGVSGGLGWLAPSTALGFDDVADAECADAATRSLVVPANGVCGFPLAEPAQLRLCPADSAEVEVVVVGADYPEQRLEASELGCDPRTDPIRIFDRQSVMTITCVALATCTLAVAEPEG
jgi:hypothetical protein